MSEVFDPRVVLVGILLLGLQACGSDEQTASKTSEDVSVTAEEVMQQPVDAEPPKMEAEEPTDREVALKTVDELVPEPAPELVHNVVYQETMYKGWPYQEEARNIPQTDSSTGEGMMEKAKEMVDDKTSEMEKTVVDKIADVSGESSESVSGMVDKGKDMLATVVPGDDSSNSNQSVLGKSHRINAEARVFNPAIIYIAPGDTIKFDNMTSHNSVSYVIPEGTKGWGEKGKGLGNNISVKLDQPGIYGYACDPHIGFGMVGVVVVGDVTADDIAATKQVAADTLEGPYKRIIGKINKIKPTK